MSKRKREDRARERHQHPRECDNALDAWLLHGGITNQQLLSLVQANGQVRLPTEGVSASTISDATRGRYLAIRVTKQLDRESGGPYQWSFCCPNLMLSMLISESEELQALYSRALDETPNSMDKPWSLAIGFDEFAPGNKLKVDNRRKAMVLSFNFLELGAHALASDATWLTPIVVLHSVSADVVGGWAAMLREYIRHQLLSANGLMTSGVAIVLHGRTVNLFARLTNILSDGDGLRMAYDWKGSSSIKPCLKHWNIFKKDSGMIEGPDPSWVEITSANHRSHLRWSSGDAAQAMDLLIKAEEQVAAGTMTKVRFDNMCKIQGFNPNPRGLLADKELGHHISFMDVATYDWAHCALQDGSLSSEVQAFVESTGIPLRDIRSFLQDRTWRFPLSHTRKARCVWRVFEECRKSEEAHKLKCSASELLSMYGLLRNMIETRNLAPGTPQRESFEACCKVIDVLLLTKRGGVDIREGSAAMLTLLDNYMAAHLRAYGGNGIRPKHHWMFDVAEQLARDLMVLDMFVIERLHLRVKKLADTRSALHSFSDSVLASLLCSQVHALRSKEFGNRMVGNLVPMPGFPTAQLADSIEVYGMTISVHDVVVHAGGIGQVLACCKEEDQLACIVSVMPVVATVGCSFTCRTSSQRAVWKIEQILPALAWKREGDGNVTVVSM